MAVLALRSWPEAPAGAAVSSLPRQRPAAASADSPWSWASLAGRLVEVSSWGGAPALTMALALVRDAQQEGESAAWVTAAAASFYPPDAAASGVDLEALVVVRLPAADDVARAADKLLRSGAFGLVVMDLGARAAIAAPLQARLAGLAHKHGAALVGLTVKQHDDVSLGAMASLRVAARGEQAGPGRFRCVVEAVKDKRRALGWTHGELFHGPAGLR